MVIRAQELQIIQPVPMMTRLRVSVAIQRVGGASVRMLQEVLRESDGGIVAQALVTGVYVLHGRPARVPDVLRERACSDGPDQLMPCLGDPVGLPRTERIHILPSDIDLYQHMNHARYLAHFEDVRFLAAPDMGAWLNQRLRAVALDYRAEVKLGEVVQIQMWDAGPSSRVFQLVRADGVVACRLDAAYQVL